MARSLNHSKVDSQLTHSESEALSLAAIDGWLTVTPEIGDTALARWQLERERAAQPFAVARIEPQRATLWFILQAGREWGDEERGSISRLLATVLGFILTPNSVRAFVQLGSEATVMRHLLAVTGS